MQCKSCGKEIVFLRTDRGNSIPVDKETVDAVDEYFDKDRHVTHFSTCPDAKKFRKEKK